MLARIAIARDRKERGRDIANGWTEAALEPAPTSPERPAYDAALALVTSMEEIMSKELAPLELAMALLGQAEAAAVPPPLLGGVPPFRRVGVPLVTDRPARPAGNRAGLFPGELDTDPAPVPRGVRGFAGPPEMVDAVVETLRTMKPTPVEEPQVEEPEEKPETEEQALARMSQRTSRSSRQSRGLELVRPPPRGRSEQAGRRSRACRSAAARRRSEARRRSGAREEEAEARGEGSTRRS